MPNKFLPPKTSTVTRTAATPIDGEILYDTDEKKLYYGDGTTTGGKAIGSPTVTDDVFRIQDNTDSTKQLAFETSGITTGTTRTLTVPDSNGTVLSTDTLTDKALYYYDASSKLFKPVGIGTSDQVLVAKPFSNPPIQWATPIGREALTANRTYYVRTDGNDSNNGLTDTAGGAFLTIGKANDTLKKLDGNGYEGFIQLGNGTYTLTSTVFLNNYVGFSKITVQGNAATPTNVVVTTSTINDSNTTNNTGLFVVNGANSCLVLVKDMRVQCTTSSGWTYLIRSLNGGYLQVSGIDFGSANSGSAITIHLNAGAGIIEVAGDYTISGGASYHVNASRDGLFICQSKTINITNTPAWGLYGFECAGGKIYINGNTYNGSATGIRYNVARLGLIQVVGAGGSYLPGNVNGVVETTTYGVYA